MQNNFQSLGVSYVAYIVVDFWLTSVVSFESNALKTRDRQEKLERVDLLFVDLDSTCRDYKHLPHSEITLAKSQ